MATDDGYQCPAGCGCKGKGRRKSGHFRTARDPVYDLPTDPSHTWKTVRVHGMAMKECSACGCRLGSAASKRNCADVVAKYRGRSRTRGRTATRAQRRAGRR